MGKLGRVWIFVDMFLGCDKVDRGWMVMVDMFMVGLEYCLRE